MGLAVASKVLATGSVVPSRLVLLGRDGTAAGCRSDAGERQVVVQDRRGAAARLVDTHAAVSEVPVADAEHSHRRPSASAPCDGGRVRRLRLFAIVASVSAILAVLGCTPLASTGPGLQVRARKRLRGRDSCCP